MNIPLSNIIRIKTLDCLRKTNQLAVYKKYIKNQFDYTKEDIEQYQHEKFKDIFNFHYQNNPTYKAFVDKNGNIGGNFDIQDIPIISKDFFRGNKSTYVLFNEIARSKHSSGTSGNPLTYHLSKDSLEGQWPAFWRALGIYGIYPCDKMLMIAGHSLFNNRTFKRKIYDYINNFFVVPAFDLTDDLFERTYKLMIKKKIKAIYAYSSCALLFLQFLQKRNLNLNLKAIFTTAELFIPSLRSLAKKYCHCEVIDTYGANDGGVQAFECPYHEGYHLNFEKCFVEIIDGEIVLTDLLNTAMPFIRYRVGDCTSGKYIIKEKCKCGRSLFRIPDISGRINEYIEDIDSNIVHTAFFNQLFAADKHIIQFQVIKESECICVNIIHDNSFEDKFYLNKYSTLINRRIKMPIKFVFDKPIKRLDNMKIPVFWNKK